MGDFDILSPGDVLDLPQAIYSYSFNRDLCKALGGQIIATSHDLTPKGS